MHETPRMTPEQARVALAAMTEKDFPTVSLDEVYDEKGHLITEDSINRLIDAAHRLHDQGVTPGGNST